MKIALIKEGKLPADRRVAFTPKQLLAIQESYPNLSFKIEPSEVRSFDDEEYRSLGIEVNADISDCDMMIGIKEVPISQLIPQKTFVFFSHTIKKQPFNRPLLKAVLAKQIRLIDYEVIKNEEGERLVAFGRWAGIVGAYNGLWTYGQKSGLYSIKRAFMCFDRVELEQELSKVKLPPIKIVVTGTGRVGKGVVEVLLSAGVEQVDRQAFLTSYFDSPVFTVLSSADYNRRKTDGGFDRSEFHQDPSRYESHFLKFAEVSDILMAAAYWDNRAPKLFNFADIQSEDFNISVIADITCDIHGSIPTTIRASKVSDPVYDIDRESFEEVPAFGKQHSISVMAIDNLPSELPRDASEAFGDMLKQYFLPELTKEASQIIRRATIAENGELTDDFLYLTDYVQGD
ncbi:NAD(P)-dependent oxidoreductase [Belliella kenyensis]|uniref:Saccharopine dehydrogenase [NAD(+), L-lysine-forming] n=1 Tax=Belliella kenyensis TaxID=1472724 RepID=A0ABV8EJB1_9BACT|nr:NAD(P)-dependent oxidoreductase [Belliella kenyensis]MCH7403701.1 NAD(P)-dependent oxidoreductase [Belliella kenyensis]MDN3603468.1 NAD(P)-dependent oxidoreductase [Belliella kenyensis]